MKLGLLSAFAAALAVASATAVRADTIYIEEPAIVGSPGYVYAAPAEGVATYVLTPPARIVAPEPDAVVVAPRRRVIVVTPQPELVVPRYGYRVERRTYREVPVRTASPLVTSVYAAPACTIDRFGVERCF